MIKLGIFLISISLINKSLFSQSAKDTFPLYSWSYYDYLEKSNLNYDALTFLKTYPDSLRNVEVNDKISQEIAENYIKLQVYDSANVYMQKIICFKDSATLGYAINLAFSLGDTVSVNKYITAFPEFNSNGDICIYKLALCMILQKKINLSGVPENENSAEFNSIIQKYINYKKKSALKAGILSAIIPGLGKSYLGYKYQARSSFIFNLAFASLLLEATMKKINLVRLGVAIPLFITFYTGNIWGTVLLTKKRNVDFENTINEEITTYFRHRLLYGH
jgi:hypothetical protein